MTPIEPQPPEWPPERPWFQFTLRTLLLVFVVFASSLAVFGAAGIVVFILVVGLAISVREVESLQSLAYRLLLLIVLAFVIASLILPAVNGALEAAWRASCANNLKQIALALNQYEATYGCFPPAYTTDKSGKPLLSWRVLLLPYLDGNPLYKDFNLKEGWDGPTNISLSATPLSIYTCPSDFVAGKRNPTQTSYLAVVGKNASWAGGTPRKRSDLSAKPAVDTIMVVEVANSGIAWAEPRDLSLDSLARSDSSPRDFSTHHSPDQDFFFIYEHDSCVNVAFGDGSIRSLRLASLSREELRKIFEIGNVPQVNAEMNDSNIRRRLNWPNIAALAVWLVSVGLLLLLAVRSRKNRRPSPIDVRGCH